MKRIIEFVKGILVFVLYFIIMPIGFSMLLSGIDKNNKIVVNVALSAAEISMFLILFFIYRKTLIENFKRFKKNWRKNLDVGFKYYFVGLIVMIVANLLLTIATGGIAANESTNREYLKLFPVYSIVAMVFVGPLVEEIVFRLGFRKAFKKWLPFALFSALFFGGMHVYTAFEGHNLAYILKNWIQILYIVPYGSLGFAFAKAYFETDNIWTTMTIHLLHNAFTILLILAAA